MRIDFMDLRQRYRRLTFWNRLGVWGSLASLASLLLAFPTLCPGGRLSSSSKSADAHQLPSQTRASSLRRAPSVVEGSLTVAQMEQLVADIQTTRGTISIEFLPDVAPNHVRNFIALAKSGFYDGTTFHRVHPLFMIQGGDPNSRLSNRSLWGLGGSGHTVEAEFNETPHDRGVISMARAADPDSATSQFFICIERKRELDGMYTAFGKVFRGMGVIDRIAAEPRDSSDRPLKPVAIQHITIHPRHE